MSLSLLIHWCIIVIEIPLGKSGALDCVKIGNAVISVYWKTQMRERDREREQVHKEVERKSKTQTKTKDTERQRLEHMREVKREGQRRG